MNRQNSALVAGAVLLWWLLDRSQGSDSTTTGATSTAPGVTFPPVVPIGGGMQPQQPERGWLMNVVDAGVEYVKRLARGIRNHNPLNIIYSRANAWDGQTGSDGKYAIFSHPKYGVRAGGKILDAYARQGYRTLRQIITRWAPAVENNVESYLAHVRAQTGWSDSKVPARVDYPRLVAAMIRHENGTNPYSAVELAEWLMLP